uniref:Sugar transporter n=1 Tax=Nilaparvata lugens TaxID=108931 RepID=A0A0A8JAG8_NILLU|nr:sugar transporter [Nilaparvata lugens]
MGCSTNKTEKADHLASILKQYLAASAALLAVLINGTFSGWATPCLPLLLSPDHSPLPVTLTKVDASWMMSQLFIGQTLSPLPSGYLMDRLGRKPTLLYCAVLPLAAWVLIFFAQDVYALSAAMFLAGLFVGTVYTVTPMYLGEIAEPSVRGRIITLTSVTTRLGIIFQVTIGVLLPFRLQAIVSLSVPLLFMLVFPLVPESPYYHLMRRDRNKAESALKWLRGSGRSKANLEAELCELESAVDKQMRNKGDFRDLISTRGSRKALMTVETLAVLQRLSSMGPVMGYISTTLPLADFLQRLGPAACVVVIDLVRLCSGLVSSMLVDCLGRRALLITSGAFCGVIMMCAGGWFYCDATGFLDVSAPHLRWVPFICLLLHGIGFSLGLGPVCSAVRSEFFPMNIKAKSSAVTSTILAFASFLINKFYLTIGDSLGMHYNYWMYGVSCFAVCLFASCFMIETKGKSLQQIQDELNDDYTPHKEEKETEYEKSENNNVEMKV